MVRNSKRCRNTQPSIKYRWNLLEGEFFELSDFVTDECTPSLSDKNKLSSSSSELKSSGVLTTAELLSLVGNIWNRASNLAVFQPKDNLKGSYYTRHKESLSFSDLAADLKNAGEFSSQERLNLTEKVALLGCGGTFRQKSLQRLILYKLAKINGRTREITSSGLEDTLVVEKKIEYRTSPANQLVNENPRNCADLTEHSNYSPYGKNSSATTLCSDYFLTAVQDIEEDGAVVKTCSSLAADYHVNCLVSSDFASEESQHKNEEHTFLESQTIVNKEYHIEDEPEIEIFSERTDIPHDALAKQKHAFAGALAGAFVSLCLHPFDSVKTIIQSCHPTQKSIFSVAQSIISERGITGLYRGISSNIASSAPISALYTFTYESVKGALLPFLPKEYQSIAHCIAGGCSSIATSFVFTPSERVKQQMQVGLHYQNCWNALVGIIRKGGLPSLYVGWGAVLCRNIPQSIIKFYMYETLKQLVVSSLHSGTQPATVQMLICGGLAGSAAALFSTPFDVVKTRLQIQIPGSKSPYVGVFHALQEIGKHEGLSGLYRGLTPRLVMYMSQGALFFTSYEFLKSSFSLEVP